ncbi:4'-phosphopantetheinyl transferase [Collimonas arenae]|uniref:4'-phosphopantetheinyl transferase n=1 Tax=Collimonas arenae TaxID=279058 RepID=A0A0A1F918_9BURK|nr:4'-phosphopantetheinyl transferase superfamily protein [Collimonas arenae]AIY41036.1 4'-phosphopantetheinyl transferase [Collimonas arenae]
MAAADPDPLRIDLWLTPLDDQRDSRLLEAYRQLLSAEEQRRAQRFLRERDRHRYLVTRALVRTVLARFSGRAPESLRFKENRHGKPSLCAIDSCQRALSFNLSHCDDMIVLALTRERELGVDIENVALRPAPLHIARRYFAQEEVVDLGTLSAAAQRQRFFELWTLKEAYIKARGMGLAIPLDQFGFRFDASDRLAMWMHPDLGDCPSRWHHWQIRIASDYLVAICAEHRAATPFPSISATRTIPLVSEEHIGHVQLRTLNLDPALESLPRTGAKKQGR